MNRYAGLNEPQDELDFHGAGPLSGREVKQRTEAFVRSAAKRGLARVRIVTGKGLHSRGKPLVRPQVERTLRALEGEGLVTSYRREKIGQGDEGAFFVQLGT